MKTGARRCPSPLGRGIWLLLLLVGSTPGLARAWDLGGVIDLTGVRAEVDGVKKDTLRQDYLVNLNHAFTPMIDFRAGFRYYRFDLAQVLATDAYTETLQPSGELLWRHPNFSLSTSAFRRLNRAFPVFGNLVTDNVSVAFETIAERHPTFHARYDFQQVYDQLDVDFRDTSNKRLQAGADWRMTKHDLAYIYTHQISDNVISGLSSKEDRHSFRWRGRFDPDAARQWKIGTNYRYEYSDVLSEVATGARFFESIPVRVGLFTVNNIPTVGELDPVPSLSDGNTTVPAAPPIDIGGATTGVNIGADLGFSRPVAALYIWTDRASGGFLSWRVYISEDNLNWDLHSAVPIYRFNPAVNRYEVEFPQVTARYVKAVKNGLNPVGTVLVTEITAFEELQDNDEVRRVARNHLADARVDYAISPWVRTALDLGLVNDNGPGQVGDRTRFDYAARGTWEPSQTWSHHLRWEQSMRWFESERASERDDGASYTLMWDPWRTLKGNVSLNHRRGYAGGNDRDQIRSAIARLTGTPLPNFNLTLDGGRSEAWDFISGRISRNWTVGALLDGKMLSFMDLSLAWNYQDILVQPDQDQRYRNFYRIGFSFQLTRTIYGRGNLSFVSDITTNTTQNYLLGWNFLPSLRAVAQYFYNGTGEDYRTERYNLNLTWSLTTRSRAYGRYSVVDFRRAGGQYTESYELGFRIGF